MGQWIWTITNFRALYWAMAALLAFLVSGCSLVAGQNGPIVYVSDADGNREIYLLDAESGESLRLTNNDTADADPRWSYDGENIAYVSLEDGDREISAIDKNGSQKVRLTNNPGPDFSPRWSPVERKLAYVSQRQAQNNARSEIYYVSLDNPEANQVTFEDSAEQLGDWSPDGEWIIFYNLEPASSRGLWLRNPEGVNLIRLTEEHDTEPRWSPDGKYIAFVRQHGDGRAIYVAGKANGDSWDGGLDETRLTQGGIEDYSPVWHPNSKILAFVSTRDGNPEIYTMQADGAELRRLTSNQANDSSPVWAPDGKQLAFVTDLFGSADILVMDADGARQRRLTKSDGEDVRPDW